MDVIKSSRFWLALVGLGIIGALAILGRLSAESAAGYLMTLIAGFGVAKAGSSTTGAAKALLPFLLFAGVASATLGASGCVCSSPRACLVTAQKATAMADAPALKLIGDKCLDEATKCGPVGSANCPGWQKCDKARTAYKAALDALGGSLATCNRVLFDLGVK